VWEFFMAYDGRLSSLKHAINWRLFGPFLIPAGLASFFLCHYIKFGDFFLYLHVQKNWGRAFKLNKEHFEALSSPAVVNLTLDVAIVVFALVAAFFRPLHHCPLSNLHLGRIHKKLRGALCLDFFIHPVARYECHSIRE